MAASNKTKSISVLRWFALLPIPLLWAAAEHYGWLKFMENRSVDWRFQARGELESTVKLIYVDMDSLSLNKIGNHPWTRDLYAKVGAALVNEAKVKAVAFDIVFSDTGVPQSADRELIKQANAEFLSFLKKEPPVVLAAAYAGWKFVDQLGKTLERDLPILAKPTRLPKDWEPPEVPRILIQGNKRQGVFMVPPVPIGLIDTIEDRTRAVPAWAPNNLGIDYFAMAVELARIYLDVPPAPEGLRVRGGQLEFVKAGSVIKSVPLIDGQILEVNWFTRWLAASNNSSPKSAPSHVEFNDVLKLARQLESKDPALVQEAKEFFSDPEFKGAVVLVGPVDAHLGDLAPTSLDSDPVPKVSVHGNLLRTIVSGLTLRRPQAWHNQVIVFGLTAIVLVLSVAGGGRAIYAKVLWGLGAMFALVVYGVAVFWSFKQGHWVLPFFTPLGAAFTTSVAGLVIQFLDAQKAKARVQGMFGTYVSPQLVERMVESGEDPELGGDDREITAYFSDIQGFSKFSEMLNSRQLVELLNEYLTACTDIVQEHDGTLDKFIGDAVVAMYGAPIKLEPHAFRACLTSQLVHQKLGELRAKWRSEGDKWPQIVWNMQTRIGLNSGPCTIGNMGSLGTERSRPRFNYTMMGDNVNLAARMESGAKGWGAYTMATEDTRVACAKHDGGRIVFRHLGSIQVMGRSQAVPVHEIVGLKEHVAQSTHECLGLFEQGLAKLHQRDWDGAIALFEKSSQLEPNQPGKTPGVKLNPSLARIEHVEKYKHEPPPDDWDGRYVATEK